jgi:hypothetical protein
MKLSNIAAAQQLAERLDWLERILRTIDGTPPTCNYFKLTITTTAYEHSDTDLMASIKQACLTHYSAQYDTYKEKLRSLGVTFPGDEE